MNRNLGAIGLLTLGTLGVSAPTTPAGESGAALLGAEAPRNQPRLAGVIFARAGSPVAGAGEQRVHSGVIDIPGDHRDIVNNARVLTREWTKQFQKPDIAHTVQSWRVTIVELDEEKGDDRPADAVVPPLPKAKGQRQVAFAVWLKADAEGRLTSPAFWFDAVQDSRMKFTLVDAEGKAAEDLAFDLVARPRGQAPETVEPILIGAGLRHGDSIAVPSEVSDRLEGERWFRVIRGERPAGAEGDEGPWWILAYRELP